MSDFDNIAKSLENGGASWFFDREENSIVITTDGHKVKIFFDENGNIRKQENLCLIIAMNRPNK